MAQTSDTDPLARRFRQRAQLRRLQIGVVTAALLATGAFWTLAADHDDAAASAGQPTQASADARGWDGDEDRWDDDADVGTRAQTWPAPAQSTAPPVAGSGGS